MNVFKKVVLSGTPRERGVTYGRECAALIERTISDYARYFDNKKNLSWSYVKEMAQKFIPAIEAFAPELMEEMRGIAEGANRSFDEILAVNCRSELLRFEGSHDGGALDECSCIGVMPERTKNGHVMTAQNWDMYYWAEEHGVVLEVLQEDGPDYFCLTEAGQLARYGMNQAGIGLAINSLPREIETDPIGVPSAVVRRKFISTGSWSECLDILFSIRHMAPMNFLVSNGNLQGDMMCLEAGAVGAQILYPEDGLLYHTNHFLSPGHLLHGRKGSSVNRYNTLRRLLKDKEQIGIEDMIAALNSTFGAPESVLNQRNPRDKEIEQCATLACFIIDATERRFWVRKGNIRENPFIEYKWTRPDKIFAVWR